LVTLAAFLAQFRSARSPGEFDVEWPAKEDDTLHLLYFLVKCATYHTVNEGEVYLEVDGCDVDVMISKQLSNIIRLDIFAQITNEDATNSRLVIRTFIFITATPAAIFVVNRSVGHYFGIST
jgi:hypothetical protein